MLGTCRTEFVLVATDAMGGGSGTEGTVARVLAEVGEFRNKVGRKLGVDVVVFRVIPVTHESVETRGLVRAQRTFVDVISGFVWIFWIFLFFFGRNFVFNWIFWRLGLVHEFDHFEGEVGGVRVSVYVFCFVQEVQRGFLETGVVDPAYAERDAGRVSEWGNRVFEVDFLCFGSGEWEGVY